MQSDLPNTQPSVQEALKPIPITPEESLKLNGFLGRVCDVLRTQQDLDSKITDVLEGWLKETHQK